MSRFHFFVFCKAPFYLLYVLVPAFLVAVLAMPAAESLKMLNVAFAAVGFMAGIGFSWAQSVPEGAAKDKVMLASKRFLHCLMLLFLAILLKFVAMVGIPGVGVPRVMAVVIVVLVWYAVGTALVFFYSGLHMTSRLLWHDEPPKTES
jgi:hypothetical protein